jgi:hypothetical protein
MGSNPGLSDALTTRLDLIHNLARTHPQWVRLMNSYFDEENCVWLYSITQPTVAYEEA